MTSILTWNINSIRQRLAHLESISARYNPDIICLQETKVQNKDFPLGACKDMGYQAIIFAGIPSYNGVAILAKQSIDCHGSHSLLEKNDARYLWAEINGVLIHNFYVPSGGNTPSMDAEKFAYKIRFLQQMESILLELEFCKKPQILLGDLNVAPLPEDVFDHKFMSRIVSHTPLERQTLLRLKDSIAFEDNVRKSYGPQVPIFSWWSYRRTTSTTNENSRGLRLDHIWTKKDAEIFQNASSQVLTEVRNWQKPSDHAPILMHF